MSSNMSARDREGEGHRMGLLEDHVVLVTGGGSGLGRGVARYLQQEGAQLAILEYDAAKVSDLVDEFGAGVLVVHGDVRSVPDLERTRASIVERYGRLSAVVATQGIWDGNVPLRDIPVNEVSSVLDEVHAVNLKGYVLTARIMFDLLKQERGALVLTGSNAGFAADGGGVPYTTSKGAVRSLVNQLAFEFAPEVRVNGVAPTGIAKSQLRGPDTLGLAMTRQSDVPEDLFRSHFESAAPLAYLPEPEDYGPIYALLASHRNRVMTGQTILADSGLFNRAFISAGG